MTYFKNLQVIVKFISKTRIVSDCWVDDPMLGRVSQEIAILTRVTHHNIVKVAVWFASHDPVASFQNNVFLIVNCVASPHTPVLVSPGAGGV